MKISDLKKGEIYEFKSPDEHRILEFIDSKKSAGFEFAVFKEKPSNKRVEIADFGVEKYLKLIEKCSKSHNKKTT
jgi:hypothetical protein